MNATTDRHWGIVLAGGEGRRLKSFIRLHWGFMRPKQYCTIIGGQSMLRHTLARAERLIPPERLLTVVSRQHLGYAREELYDRPPGTVIIQPCNRDTGPGILLPLLHIYPRDPDAIVTLLPSDHFIVEEERLMAVAQEAASFVVSSPGYLVLLGVEPDRPETEYGWIELGQSLGQELGGRGEAEALQALYRRLHSVNFSRAILARGVECLSVLRVKGVYWSDWGNPEQVRKDVARFAPVSLHQTRLSNNPS